MGRQLKILYVDDEEPLRMLVQEQLTENGLEVETADDGDTALSMIEKNSYDVMILDIRMPRVNGLEVLKNLKLQSKSLPIVMLTAVDDISVAIEAVKNGAQEYMEKPFDIDELLACITRVKHQKR